MSETRASTVSGFSRFQMFLIQTKKTIELQPVLLEDGHSLPQSFDSSENSFFFSLNHC